MPQLHTTKEGDTRMTLHDTTLVERLSGLAPDSPLARAYRAKTAARAYAEESYRRLLLPAGPGPVPLVERRAIAAFVAVLNGEAQTRAHFLTLLEATAPSPSSLAPLIEREAEGSAHPGPYGRLPHGPLSAEDLDGPVYRVAADLRAMIGARLAAGLEHAHLVTLHPHDATPAARDRLAEAGWRPDGIALLTDIIDLVNFQSRVVAGLRAYLAARQPAHAA